jgi:hypothetical protein
VSVDCALTRELPLLENVACLGRLKDWTAAQIANALKTDKDDTSAPRSVRKRSCMAKETSRARLSLLLIAVSACAQGVNADATQDLGLAGGTFWTGVANGTASGYAHWNSNEPNASGDCIVVQTGLSWDDRICTDQRKYICD